jgi:importin-7
MWQAFELIVQTFKAGAELYLEDMLPALDNFVQYGHQHLIETPAYLAAMFGMVQDMFADEKVGGVDRICACKLAEGIMLSLRGHADPQVVEFVRLGPVSAGNMLIELQIGMAMRTLTSSEVKIKSYKIHLMEMVINATYYNPVRNHDATCDAPH